MTQTALVTGADGFIGFHLSELLVNHDLGVRQLAQYESFNNEGGLSIPIAWIRLSSLVATVVIHGPAIRPLSRSEEYFM